MALRRAPVDAMVGRAPPAWGRRRWPCRWLSVACRSYATGSVLRLGARSSRVELLLERRGKAVLLSEVAKPFERLSLPTVVPEDFEAEATDFFWSSGGLGLAAGPLPGQ